MTHLPRIAITPGEPAGIGPDLVIALAQRAHAAELVAVADPDLLEQRARQLNLQIEIVPFRAQSAHKPRSGRLYCLPVLLEAPVRAGVLDPANAEYVVATLRRAIDGCLEGEFAALVTGPVHKGVINDAGISFTGHTEFLAEYTGSDPVMMLVASASNHLLRIALATTHLPLAKVSEAITHERLIRVIRVLDKDLRTRFRITRPRILVCGLNPHAGEGGYLGVEEIEIITPALDALRREDIDLIGPLPADTLFIPKNLEKADAVLAMYHDQGLPVLKHAGFGRAVNVTLGLPIIRTSVDHGTALDLAGAGRADAGSFQAALDLAIELNTRCSMPVADKRGGNVD